MLKTKVVTIILGLTMTAGVLAGCGSTKQEAQPATQPNSTQQTQQTPPASAPAATTPSASDAKNGTFTAKDKADERGYVGEVSVTYENGKLTKVVFDEVKDGSNKKSADAAYADAMKKTQKITPAEAYAKLTASALNGKVDTVTGATSSSTRFRTLFEQAQAMKK